MQVIPQEHHSNDECLENIRKNMFTSNLNINDKHYFIVLGASGDLASKKIYPSLWFLFREKLLPLNVQFIGYARSNIDVNKLRSNMEKYCKIKPEEQAMFNHYISKHSYIRGSYDQSTDFKKLHEQLNAKGSVCHRIFYLALPPSVYESVCALISNHCRPDCPKLWMRVIVEKPFGKDLDSSDHLEKQINKYLSEKEVYRIDHYLGKEMVQSLIILRFTNSIFSRMWNRDAIACVLITFKENIGTLGRGGYFDEYGIIRDIMQNHLLQIMSVVAMDPPVSLTADDIRDEKIKVLRSIDSISKENIIIGQYIGNTEGETDDQRTSYIDDPSVKNKDSKTPTFACAVVYINNERWHGVPFILKCGKALNERKTEIRIQFKTCPTAQLFRCPTQPAQQTVQEPIRDELVIRIQPDEAIYLKIMNKKPGWDFLCEQSELDLTYNERYINHPLPDAYERLIIDVFTGSQANFVRSDELHEAWRIFTPMLKHLEVEGVPKKYVFGNRTVDEADELCKKVGFTYTSHYKWPGKRSNTGPEDAELVMVDCIIKSRSMCLVIELLMKQMNSVKKVGFTYTSHCKWPGKRSNTGMFREEYLLKNYCIILF